MPFGRTIPGETFLNIGENNIQITHISNIIISEKAGMESITFILTFSPSVSLHGEDAKKYMTSLKAFMNVYGCIGLLEYAEKLADEEIMALREEEEDDRTRRHGWKGH